MSDLVTAYGCQTVPGTNQMPLQFSPIWRCNFLHFGLQLLVILLYNIMYPYVWTLLKVEPHPLDNLKIDVPTEWTPSYNCSDLMVFYLQEKEMYHHEQEAIYR